MRYQATEGVGRILEVTREASALRSHVNGNGGGVELSRYPSRSRAAFIAAGAPARIRCR
jgi:hypothetical protein